ncbi:MAG: Gfo/Idh/MocA family protein [Candidatus Zipacnadales bacterium]
MSATIWTRRNFVRRLSISAATFAVGQRLRAQGANDRLSLGIIGAGGRGTALMQEAQQYAQELNVEFTAVCDVWRPARERAAARIKEWTGKDPRSFSRFAEMLALEDLDAVMIATPDFAHSPILAAAARAGKHVYCEKPMATNMEDALTATTAVQESGVICQIGTQRRSDGRHKAGAKLIQDGVIGQVSEVQTGAHDNGPRWSRSYSDVKAEDVDWEQFLMDLPAREFDPRRFRCWHLYKDYTNGTPGLWGSHLIDVSAWFMDDPLPVSGIAFGGIYVWKDRELPDTMTCLYEYPKGFMLNFSMRLGNSFNLAEAIFLGTKGTFDTASWTAKPQGGGKEKLTEEIKLTDIPPSENHVHNWLSCIRNGGTPNAPVETGYAHSVAAIMAFRAWETGQRQIYDVERREIRPG